MRSNLTLATLPALSRGSGWIDRRRETARRRGDLAQPASTCAARRLEQRVDELSGGNQQKVVLARWLLRDCEVLLVDEPTRGIDVGAKRAVHAALRELAARGKALVVVSSELEELMALCDRIAVLSDGRAGRRRSIARRAGRGGASPPRRSAATHGMAGAVSVAAATARLAHAEYVGLARGCSSCCVLRSSARLSEHFLTRLTFTTLANQIPALDRDRGRHDARADRRRHRPVGRLGAGAGLGGAGDRAGRLALAAAARARRCAWSSACSPASSTAWSPCAGRCPRSSSRSACWKRRAAAPISSPTRGRSTSAAGSTAIGTPLPGLGPVAGVPRRRRWSSPPGRCC